MSERQEAKTIPSVDAKRRAAEPGYLPGYTDAIEEAIGEPVKKKVVRSNKLWQNAEDAIAFIAMRAGYEVKTQQWIGRSHGTKTRVDIVCTLPGDENRRIIVSVKWYMHSGSWDDKIPEEVTKLERIATSEKNIKAWVVLCGPGLDPKKKERWLAEFIDTTHVRVCSVDFFMGVAGSHELWNTVVNRYKPRSRRRSQR
jgi:hypothetical protein